MHHYTNAIVAALQAYAKQQDDNEMESWLAEVKLRARRRIGEISRDLEKIQPGDSGGMATKGLPSAGQTSKQETLKEAGISTSAANRFEKVAAIPEDNLIHSGAGMIYSKIEK